ncbi:MAG TPA: hypothetical protein VEZ72_20615 [Paenibacillus sp.]|nr:hypothetical protein [Paenibacillus sp.]
MKRSISGILAFSLSLGLAQAAFPGAARAAPNTIPNPSFETGDLTGWTIEQGDAFGAADVAADANYWDRREFKQHNFWHIWGGRGDDSKTGVLKSEPFILGGDGRIDFLIGGANDIANVYVALVDATNDAELLKSTGTNSDEYTRAQWNASAHIGKTVYIRLVDQSTTGHLNLDDVNVPPTPSLNAHVEPALYNHDFEQSDLFPNEIRGWINVSGDAFAPSSLVHEEVYSQGGPFRHAGHYHLWGFKSGGDGQTGSIRSATFTLGGNGGIDFLVNGGRDIDNLYVALVRASDGAILMKETGRDSEAYQRVFWDASAHLGQDVFIRVYDHSSSGSRASDLISRQCAPVPHWNASMPCR